MPAERRPGHTDFSAADWGGLSLGGNARRPWAGLHSKPPKCRGETAELQSAGLDSPHPAVYKCRPYSEVVNLPSNVIIYTGSSPYAKLKNVE